MVTENVFIGPYIVKGNVDWLNFTALIVNQVDS